MERNAFSVLFLHNYYKGFTNVGGKVDVRISMKKDKTILEVEDNGIGIDESNQTRIFERFYRVDKSRSRETAGTGLGFLSLSTLLSLYNANVRLQSKIELEHLLGWFSKMHLILQSKKS